MVNSLAKKMRYIDGTYISEDGLYVLSISDSDVNTGTFNFTFNTKESPLGNFTYSERKGSWTYAGEKHYPCGINFSAGVRDEPDWKYYMLDSWNGSRTRDGLMVLNGSRCYIVGDVSVTLYTFENIKFNLS
ncbi:hypothetical protein [Enterobacter asburiae]|uniref:hypothetical protein n=1 Tax=Enterobacter asburiae TaxID=61645 RepID=UPI00301BFAE5